MEEKIGKTSVSRPGDLSEGEIDATVKAILEDTDVHDLLAKIGITKGQAYQDLSNKKFILPKKGEDEVGYAKRYIKFQVVAILMNKYNEKIHDDTSEEARRQAEKLAGQHATNLKRGDVAAIIAMIESQGYLLSRDGKTAKKLTPKQKDIIVRKLREGVNSIDELLEEMEFEDEEPEIDEEQMQEDTKNNEEPTQEQFETRNEFDDENPINDIDEVGEEDDLNGVLDEVEEEQDEPDDRKAITPEDKNYKRVEFEDEEFLAKNPEYRDATYYRPPMNATIESIAADLAKIKENNADSKIIVIYDNILIDPQKTPTQEEMIGTYNEQVAKREETKAGATSVEQLLQNRSDGDNKAQKNENVKALIQRTLTPKGAVELQGNMGQVREDRRELNQELGISSPNETEKTNETVEHIYGPEDERIY